MVDGGARGGTRVISGKVSQTQTPLAVFAGLSQSFFFPAAANSPPRFSEHVPGFAILILLNVGYFHLLRTLCCCTYIKQSLPGAQKKGGNKRNGLRRYKFTKSCFLN